MARDDENPAGGRSPPTKGHHPLLAIRNETPLVDIESSRGLAASAATSVSAAASRRDGGGIDENHQRGCGSSSSDIQAIPIRPQHEQQPLQQPRRGDGRRQTTTPENLPNQQEQHHTKKAVAASPSGIRSSQPTSQKKTSNPTPTQSPPPPPLPPIPMSIAISSSSIASSPPKDILTSAGSTGQDNNKNTLQYNPVHYDDVAALTIGLPSSEAESMEGIVVPPPPPLLRSQTKIHRPLATGIGGNFLPLNSSMAVANNRASMQQQMQQIQQRQQQQKEHGGTQQHKQHGGTQPPKDPADVPSSIFLKEEGDNDADQPSSLFYQIDPREEEKVEESVDETPLYLHQASSCSNSSNAGTLEQKHTPKLTKEQQRQRKEQQLQKLPQPIEHPYPIPPSTSQSQPSLSSTTTAAATTDAQAAAQPLHPEPLPQPSPTPIVHSYPRSSKTAASAAAAAAASTVSEEPTSCLAVTSSKPKQRAFIEPSSAEMEDSSDHVEPPSSAFSMSSNATPSQSVATSTSVTSALNAFFGGSGHRLSSPRSSATATGARQMKPVLAGILYSKQRGRQQQGVGITNPGNVDEPSSSSLRRQHPPPTSPSNRPQRTRVQFRETILIAENDEICNVMGVGFGTTRGNITQGPHRGSANAAGHSNRGRLGARGIASGGDHDGHGSGGSTVDSVSTGSGGFGSFFMTNNKIRNIFGMNRSYSSGESSDEQYQRRRQSYRTRRTMKTMFYHRTWVFWLLFGLAFVVAAVVVPVIIAVLFKTGGDKGGSMLYTNVELQQRQDNLMSILSAAGVVDFDIDAQVYAGVDVVLNDKKSPQYQAFQWTIQSKQPLPSLDHLVIEDETGVKFEQKDQNGLSTGQLLHGERESRIAVERYIMAVFYFATNMEQAKKQLSLHGSGNDDAAELWLSEYPVCDWDDGIICDEDDGDGSVEQRGNEPTITPNTTSTSGSSSSSSLPSITKLAMSGYLLSGSIPKEVSYLPHLQELVLAYNDLTGTLPTELVHLSAQITRLDVASNLLTGSIPKNIGDLSKLTGLYLWDNQMTGPLPSSIGSMNDLQFLDIYNNAFTGAVPNDLNSLTNLHSVLIAHNSLTGSLNPIFCSNETATPTSSSESSSEASASIAMKFTKLSQLFADCGGNTPEITCDCCHKCRAFFATDQ